MCGISGFLSSDAVVEGQSSLSENAVRRMSAALAHRGPDAEGFYVRGPIALGHRRLSIIDLRPEANQPISNEDGTVVAIVNGEIYNHESLRRELLAKGHTYRSNSDSETIVHLYEEHGEDCVRFLRGMFAFAIWDSRQQRLFLARDRVGKKPIYYAARREGFYFASELHALRQGIAASLPVDVDAIAHYMTLQYVPAPLTIYQGVAKLPAAHCLSVPLGGTPTVRKYWRLSFAPGRAISEADAVAEVRTLLEESVRLRQMSDVPLGAFLSGGVDSSTVVALLARNSTRPIKTFSVDLPQGDSGEAHFARLVAERYHTDHEELTITPDMVTIFPEIVRRYGEPFADASAVPTYYISELTKRKVTVVLSGDGGDEVFAGYHRYGLERVARALAGLPGGAAPLIASLFRRAPGDRFLILREFAPFLQKPIAERYLFFLARWHRDNEQLAGPLLAERARANLVAQDFARILAESDATDETNKLLDLDTQTYLPDDILTKVDIASMAHALEVRCPFLDHVLMERVASLPGAWKLHGVRGKQILRKAVRDLVPRPILTRRKKGFSLPLNRWLREDLAQMSRDLLTDRTARERGLFNHQYVVRLLEEHRQGINHSDRLWNLLVLEQWYRTYIDGPPSAPPCSA